MGKVFAKEIRSAFSKIKTDLFFGSSIFIICLVFYFPSIPFDFIRGLDDDWLVIHNPAIRNFSIQGIRYILFEDNLDLHYYPLTYISLAMDYHFFGLNASMMRLHNIILHGFNGILVYLILIRLFKNRELALFSGVIFIIHPLQIESVAWVICRRQVLFLFYFLAAWYTYLVLLNNTAYPRYKKLLLYSLTLLFYALSLLSKATGYFLPAILFLSQSYLSKEPLIKQFNWKKAILPYLPFILLAGFSFFLNYQADDKNFLKREFEYTSFQHFIFIFYSIGFYIIRTIFPVNQAVFYPSPEEGLNYLPGEYYFFSIIALISILFFFHALWKRDRTTVLLLGGYYISIAILTNRILLFSDLPSIVADRYYYQSALFLIALFSLFVIRTFYKQTTRIVIYTSFTLLIAFQFFNYLNAWENINTLFDRVIKHYPNKEFLMRSGVSEYKYGSMDKARERLKMAKETTDNTYILNGFWFYDELIKTYHELGDSKAVDSIYEYLGIFRPEIIQQLRDWDTFHTNNAKYPEIDYLRQEE